MKIKNLYTLVFLTLFSFVACTKHGEFTAVSTIDCTESNCKDSLDIQQFFSDASFTLLEETDGSRVGPIDKVIVKDSIIFVLDRRMAKKIFLFNQSDGKFIRSIGEVGNSKQEYFYIMDCCVDEKNKVVYTLCDCEKIIAYDYQGKFLSERNIGVTGLYTMEYHNDKFFFTCSEPGKGNLIITDGRLNILKQHFIVSPEYSIVMMLNPVRVLWDGTVTYMRYLDNTIYELGENNEPQARYRLDFGSSAVSREDVKGLSYEECNAKVNDRRGNLKFYIENEDYVFLMYYDRKKPQMTVWDKEKHTAYICPYDFVKDSVAGAFPNPITYAFDSNCVIDCDACYATPRYVSNPSVHGGNNPVIYWLYR